MNTNQKKSTNFHWSIQTEYPKEYHHILSAAVAQNLCSSIFISKREFSTTPPFIEDLSDGPGYYSTIKVDKKQQFVIATSIKYPEIQKTSKYIDNYRGCTIIREDLSTFKKRVFPLKRNKKNKKTMNIQIEKNSEIEKIINEEFQNEKIKTRSIIVYHKKKIIGERYTNEFTKNTRQFVWSITKSITNLLFGVAIHQKKLKLEDKISAPEWSPNDERNQMTVLDVLKMASSLNFTEKYGYKSDPAKLVYNSTSMASFASKKNLKNKPGTLWNYSTGDSSILSRKLRSCFKSDEEYWRFPREQLFDKIGITEGSLINVDSSLTFAGGVFGYFTPRDLLKIGIFLLNDGIVEEERILPDYWIKLTSTPTEVSRGFYGLHFWVRRELPKNCFVAVGWRKQLILICPNLDLIVIRQGLTDIFWNEITFFRKILNAI
eukprot:gene4582-7966_t